MRRAAADLFPADEQGVLAAVLAVAPAVVRAHHAEVATVRRVRSGRRGRVRHAVLVLRDVHGHDDRRRGSGGSSGARDPCRRARVVPHRVGPRRRSRRCACSTERNPPRSRRHRWSRERSRRPSRDPRRLARGAVGVPRRADPARGDRGRSAAACSRCRRASRPPTRASPTRPRRPGGTCCSRRSSARTRSGSCVWRPRATRRATTAPPSSPPSPSPSGWSTSCRASGPLGAALLVANAAAFGALLLLHALTRFELGDRGRAPSRAVHRAVSDRVLPVRAVHGVAVPARRRSRRSGSRGATAGLWAAVAGALAAAATRSVGILLILALWVEALAQQRRDGRPLLPRLAAAGGGRPRAAAVFRVVAVAPRAISGHRWTPNEPGAPAATHQPIEVIVDAIQLAWRYQTWWLLDLHGGRAGRSPASCSPRDGSP